MFPFRAIPSSSSVLEILDFHMNCLDFLNPKICLSDADDCGSKAESSDSATYEKQHDDDEDYDADDDETSWPASESGWTAYLAESDEPSSSFSKKNVCHQNKALAGAPSETKHENHSRLHGRQLPDDDHDDPSMASDASSGPHQHPLSFPQESVDPQAHMQIAHVNIEQLKKDLHQSPHENDICSKLQPTRSWGSDLPETQFSKDIKTQKKQRTDQKEQQQSIQKEHPRRQLEYMIRS